jgi:hypothetical protein
MVIDTNMELIGRRHRCLFAASHPRSRGYFSSAGVPWLQRAFWWDAPLFAQRVNFCDRQHPVAPTTDAGPQKELHRYQIQYFPYRKLNSSLTPFPAKRAGRISAPLRLPELSTLQDRSLARALYAQGRLRDTRSRRSISPAWRTPNPLPRAFTLPLRHQTPVRGRQSTPRHLRLRLRYMILTPRLHIS